MTLRPPADDADVPRFWTDLGVPGGVDVHVHVLPDRVQAKVWAWFDAQVVDGEPVWPIRYRGSIDARTATLRALGLRAWTALVYAHRPGMAAWLNDWAAEQAAAVPELVPSATFYPDADADAYVAASLERGARAWKVHFEVGGFDPADARLRPVWRRLADAGVPVVVHAGSGPVAGPYNRPEVLRRVLDGAPELTAVVAHMGMPEYGEFLDMALAHPRVHLDTTMAFTDFTQRWAPFPPALLDVLAAHPDRVVLGSDFPSIPHAYAHQLQALVRLGLGDAWLRAVCHDNGARLLGLATASTPPARA